MSIARKLGLAFGKTLILLSIIFSALGFLYFNTLSKPEKIKLWLSDSALYPAIAETIQEQFLSEERDTGQIPPEIVESAVAKTFGQETAQTFIENSIDSTYLWLNGTQDELSLELDIKDYQEDFITNLNTGLLAKLNELPSCPSGTIPSTDLFELQCIPQGVDINQVVSELTSQIDLETDAQQEVNDAIEAVDSPISKPDEGLAKNLQPVKDIYGIFKILPYVAVSLFAVGTALVIALSKPRRKALKTLAVATIPYGVIYVAFGIFLPNIVKAGVQSSIDSISEPQLKAPLEAIVANASGSIGKDLMYIGLSLLVLGAILLIGYFTIRKKHSTNSNKNKPSLHNPETNNQEKQPE